MIQVPCQFGYKQLKTVFPSSQKLIFKNIRGFQDMLQAFPIIGYFYVNIFFNPNEN